MHTEKGCSCIHSLSVCSWCEALGTAMKDALARKFWWSKLNQQFHNSESDVAVQPRGCCEHTEDRHLGWSGGRLPVEVSRTWKKEEARKHLSHLAVREKCAVELKSGKKCCEINNYELLEEHKPVNSNCHGGCGRRGSKHPVSYIF